MCVCGHHTAGKVLLTQNRRSCRQNWQNGSVKFSNNLLYFIILLNLFSDTECHHTKQNHIMTFPPLCFTVSLTWCLWIISHGGASNIAYHWTEGGWILIRLAGSHVSSLPHTYIIGHYNPSVRIIDLVSHTTYVVCVNFIREWRDLPV